MAKPAKGLGKGLASLISETVVEYGEGNPGVSNINISKLKRNEAQPRKVFDEQALQELSESIKEHGIIQPLIAVKDNVNDVYTIVAGERRYRAAIMAGLNEVPVIVKEFTEEELMQVSLIENLQREDLNAVEEALAYKALIDTFGYTQDVLAQKLGISRTALTNALRLLNLNDDVLGLISEGKLSAGHARCVLSVDKEKQSDFANHIVSEQLSVREAEKQAKTFGEIEEKPQPKKPEPKTVDPQVNFIREKLTDFFGTKVDIDANGDKGTIKISYFSNDELCRILEALNIEA